jgi:hypothetical protein
VETIIQVLRCSTPSVDAFANAENYRFPRWWGEGGEHPDAFEMNWRSEDLIWCNPPFKLLSQVVTKAISEQAKLVLICPNWPRLKWWQELQRHVHVGHLVPEGTRMFELNGRIPGPTHWDTWAYWLKATCPQQIPRVFVRPVEGETEDDEVSMPKEPIAESVPVARPPVAAMIPCKAAMPSSTGSTDTRPVTRPILRPQPPLLTREWSTFFEISLHR